MMTYPMGVERCANRWERCGKRVGEVGEGEKREGRESTLVAHFLPVFVKVTLYDRPLTPLCAFVFHNRSSAIEASSFVEAPTP